MTNKLQNSAFFKRAIDLLCLAKEQVVRQINLTMVQTYFEIGRMIVEEEQDGKNRAEYGKQLLIGLSKALTKEFGKGFSMTNIQQMRNFYLVYQKQQTLSANCKKGIPDAFSHKFVLSWSHYLKLIRIDDINERKFYEIEVIKNNWSVRELDRQYDAALYSRLVLSRDKEKVKELSEKDWSLKSRKTQSKTHIYWNLLDYQKSLNILKMIWNKESLTN